MALASEEMGPPQPGAEESDIRKARVRMWAWLADARKALLARDGGGA